MLTAANKENEGKVQALNSFDSGVSKREFFVTFDSFCKDVFPSLGLEGP